jgi:membrane-bound lytic murein transglycosylase D
MKQGEPYLGFIRRELEQRNLPPELLYLPVIESQYLPTAVSRSGAAGLWQFMKNSIAPFDMKVNDWIDERRDFWKSTFGALKKLEENYNYFGDWGLALAAYNAGLGAVNQAVKKSGTKDYWVLSGMKQLKTETIHYVPKFLAVSYILSNFRRFGLDPVWNEDPGWTRVAAERQADLNLLAAEAGVDPAALKGANRELAYAVTPPGPGYYLKVRAEDADKVTAVLARKDLPLVNYYIHTIRSGDTLLAMALHYGVTVEQILESNPGTRAQYLKIGGKLMIPAFKDVGPYTRPESGTAGLAFTGSHLVKKGETLWSIALAYKTGPEILAEANGMGLDDVLREGRVLKTPIKE